MGPPPSDAGEPSGEAPVVAASPRELALVALAAVVATIVAAVALSPFGSGASPAVTLIGLGGTALAFARLRAGTAGAGRYLGMVRPHPRALLGAVLAGTSLWLVVVILVGPLADAMPDRAATEERLAPLVATDLPLVVRLLAFAVVPAIAEELLCRGLLARHLAARLGRAAGIGLAAVYFAALHASLAQGVSVLPVGLALGAAAVWSGSTVTAIVLHAVHNTAILLVADPEVGIGDALVAPAHGRFVLGAVAAASVVLIVGLQLVRSVPSMERLR